MKQFIRPVLIIAVFLSAGSAQAMNERERYFLRFHEYPAENTPAVAPANLNNQPASAREELFQPSFARQEPGTAVTRYGLARQKAVAKDAALPASDQTTAR